MNFEDYNIIEKIASEMRAELQELEKKIKYNVQCIKEADVYANLFIDSDESDDYKIFSPRNPENAHKNEIEKAYHEKDICEKQNEQLIERRNYLLNQLKGLEKVLEHRKTDDGYTVLNIQEQDRQRIARDLHDTSLQNLTHLIHKIELSSLYIDQDTIKAKLELSIINNTLKKTIDEIRNTIFDLRPMTFDDLGFKAALERLISNINENQMYMIDADIDDVSCEKSVVLVSIYRVVQECLNNIVKHANAEKIFFSCKNEDGKCMITIQDDGIGFDEEKPLEGKHFGLSLMKERIKLINGKINISSKVQQGTSIQIEVPLNNI